ncbi:MAG: PrgI family protein [Mobilitalea sp.]
MAYVEVPKDLSRVKTKVMFNLTKRQLICFSAATLVGIPVYFLLRAYIGVSAASLMMILLVLPFFLLAVYEKNGQPLEVLAKKYIQVRFLRPKKRPYRTNNFYSILERQYQLDKEIKSIVYKQTAIKTKAYQSRTKTNRISYGEGIFK